MKFLTSSSILLLYWFGNCYSQRDHESSINKYGLASARQSHVGHIPSKEHPHHHNRLRKNHSHIHQDYFSDSFDPRIYNPHKINLGWVINSDPSFIKTYQNEISAIACYCALYQIHFYLEPALVDKEDIRDYQQVKLKNVMKYLKFHDWLFVTDADVIVGNYSKSIYDFIDDRYDVIFNDRDETLEVMAGNYFVKNSPDGFGFLWRWFNLAPTGWAFNTDNGDLQELLQQYMLNNFAIRPCQHMRNMRRYRRDFLPCVMKEIIAHRDAEYVRTNYPYSYSLPPPGQFIKLYRGFLGFFRVIIGSDSCQGLNEFWCFFLYGDFLLHGKELYKYLPPPFISCDVPAMKEIARNITGHDRDLLIPPKHRHLSFEESRKYTLERLHRPTLACPHYNPLNSTCSDEI